MGSATHLPRRVRLHPPRRVRLAVGTAVLLPAAIAIALAGCGSGGGADQTSSAAKTSTATAVTISDYTYKPATISVPRGTTIRITNEDSTPHTVTSRDAGVFESGSIDTGKTKTIRLEKTGSFAYYCVFHPFMKGMITVK